MKHHLILITIAPEISEENANAKWKKAGKKNKHIFLECKNAFKKFKVKKYFLKGGEKKECKNKICNIKSI